MNFKEYKQLIKEAQEFDKMTLEEQRNYWHDTGVYFGFPACCIYAFVNRMPKDASAEEFDGPWSGTGFIPCAKHREEIRKGLAKVTGLLADRFAIENFPNGDID